MALHLLAVFPLDCSGLFLWTRRGRNRGVNAGEQSSTQQGKAGLSHRHSGRHRRRRRRWWRQVLAIPQPADSATVQIGIDQRDAG